MQSYIAPLKDILFVRNELLNYHQHYQKLPSFSNSSKEIVDMIIEEGAKFCEQVIAPLNKIGDEEGCHLQNNKVSTPKGFKEAYQKYIEGGWPSLACSTEYGGQNLPHSLSITMSEMLGSANWAWSMYAGLSHGAVVTIETHGSDEQKKKYLPHLVSGKWTGTMCLTESHCGTDLGLLKTKATSNSDGSYNINGTKIFISSGEHDLAENIVHIVIAKTPNAPEGTKGISLFIVPKYLPGSIGENNGVYCGAIENKMGIHGNATCVINFDNAKGFLIGKINAGLQSMFTFMNFARLGTGIQGLAHCEIAMQGALSYAKERLQGRSLTGTKMPDKPADSIMVHPDIRRMLLTIKSFTEGNRALIYYTAQLSDLVDHQDQKIKEEAEELMSFLTPIVKAFVTETGIEASNLGLQCFGGHGYIKEWPMEQNVRDARIATLYEGTTGIQSLDLLGRKVLLNQGKYMKKFTKLIHFFCKENKEDTEILHLINILEKTNKEWGEVTLSIGIKAIENHDEVGAAAYDFLMYSGYVCLAYFWTKMALNAQKKIHSGCNDVNFYQGKIKTAIFYFGRILPRKNSHKEAMLSSAANLMGISESEFG